MGQLTISERQLLKDLETVIEEGQRWFVEVGRALMEIRDRKLYKHTHKNFRDYCSDRWGFEKSHSYRLIDAAKVVDNLKKVSPQGDTFPDEERQTRELSKLESSEEQAEAWEEAVEEAGGGQPTAKAVREKVQERKEATEEEPDELSLDDIAQPWKEAAAHIRKAENLLKSAAESDQGVHLSYEIQRFRSYAKDALTLIKGQTPHCWCECPRPDKCKRCLGTGWIPRVGKREGE